MKQIEIFRRYFYWAFLEIMFFFAYLVSISMHIFFHQISPFKAYMMHLNQAINFMPKEVNEHMWSDRKLDK